MRLMNVNHVGLDFYVAGIVLYVPISTPVIYSAQQLGSVHILNQFWRHSSRKSRKYSKMMKKREIL